LPLIDDTHEMRADKADFRPIRPIRLPDIRLSDERQAESGAHLRGMRLSDEREETGPIGRD
jgi:hypothetical protein